MSETPFFFSRDEHQLFGILHRPLTTNGRGFVFCHPFAEEKLWAHRVYVTYARRLCELGHSVLRFDYMGHGDSSGKFEDSSIETRLRDIAAAVQELKLQSGPMESVGLLGLRLGATLAALAAEKDAALRPLVLWEPIDSGAQYMKELLRINLATQTAVYKEIRWNSEALVDQMKKGRLVNLDGYDIRYSLYEQMCAIVLSAGSRSYPHPVLLVQINKNESQGTKRIEPLAKSYPRAAAIGVVEQPFWKEIKEYYARAHNIFAATSQWITTMDTAR